MLDILLLDVFGQCFTIVVEQYYVVPRRIPTSMSCYLSLKPLLQLRIYLILFFAKNQFNLA